MRYVSEFFTDILSTTHHLGNVLITVIGDRAAAESYAGAWHRLRTSDGGLPDLIVGGRYVDELRKRDGESVANGTSGNHVRRSCRTIAIQTL